MKQTLIVLQGITWGVMLLTLLCLTYLLPLMALDHVKDIKSADDLKQSIVTYENTKNLFVNLEKLVDTGDRKSEQANKLEGSIIHNISLCNACKNYPKRRDRLHLPFPDFSIENDYEYQNSIQDARRYLERISNPKQVGQYNNAVYFLIFSGLVATLTAIYLITALLRYSKIKARGIVIVAMITLPVISAFSILTSFYVFEGFDTYHVVTDEEYMGTFLITSLIYPFVIYPPIFLICKNKGLEIKSILLLRGYTS